MNNIILQVCQQFITETMDFFMQEKPITLPAMETGLKETSNRFIRNIIKAYLEETDRQITADKKGRKQRGLVVERKDEERTVYTRFGSLTYSRSYYLDKRKQTYLHPVDLVAGLEPYERISQTLSADLVAHAAEASYGESSRHITDGEISRQTVMKKIRQTHGLKIPAPTNKRKVATLHVNADEDHVALQDGTNTIVPVITIHEGVQKLSKNRNRCINTHHISTYGKTPEDLWLQVAQWIYDAYEVEDSLETIYIHGDGASWIKKGLEILPKSKPVLDKYHLNKSIMSCTGAQPEHRKALWWALKNADREEFKKIIRIVVKRAQSDSELKRLKEFRRYVLNNWQGIEIYKTDACGGSSAEAHVSHVLSARLSSRPMGWSREGLKYMAELRAFCANGGVVEAHHLRRREDVGRLVKKAMQQAQKVFHGINTQTLGNLAAKNIGKVTPLFRLLRSTQRGGFITP